MLDTNSTKVLLLQLGDRLLKHRLDKNMTQAALAEEAGVSGRTINRLEHGHSIQVSNLVRILRSLGLLENLEALVPGPEISPMQLLKLQGKKRKRASTTAKNDEEEAWSWGEGE